MVATYGPRLLALIDVLGFRKQLEERGAEDVGRRYSQALNSASTGGWSDIFPPFRTASLQLADFADVVLFSDTLIILSKSNSDRDTLRAHYAVWRLCQLLTVHKFPIRGALCFGDVYADVPSRVVVSSALVEADRLEKTQEWLGVCVSANAQQRIVQAVRQSADLQQFVDRTIVAYNIPMKSGPAAGYCLNWRAGLVFDAGIEAYLRDEVGLANPKLDNSLQFLRWLQTNGYRVWFRQIPDIFVGKTPPPYNFQDPL